MSTSATLVDAVGGSAPLASALAATPACSSDIDRRLARNIAMPVARPIMPNSVRAAYRVAVRAWASISGAGTPIARVHPEIGARV